MRTIIPFFCAITLVAASFTACSSDDKTTGGTGDASTGDGSSFGTDGAVSVDAATSGTDAGKTSDANTGSDAADAGVDDAGDDASNGDVDASFDGSPPADAGVAPTFTNVYAIIINGTCNGCHNGGMFPSGKLDMSTQALAYAHLVNVTSAGSGCGAKAEPRVLPNDHASSLIWNKVNGTQDCGSRMPLGQLPLSQQKIDLIAEWIDNGALDN